MIDFIMYAGEDTEEENEMLITKVVEHVEPVTAKELICKFPDNSAFDFDYTQSSIWSPLVPRAYSSINFDFDFDFDFDMVMKPTRRLSFEMENKKWSFKKIAASIKKKIATTAFSMNRYLIMKVKKKIKGSEYSPNPPSKVHFLMGRTKLLKTASKHFKRRKKRDPTSYVKLSS